MDEALTIKYEALIDLLVKVLGDFRQHHPTKTQMAFNCPTCAEIKRADGTLPAHMEVDNKYNLEVHYGKGVYNCWSCGKTHNTHGTIFDLIRRFGNEQDMGIYLSLNMQYEYVTDEDEEIERKNDNLLLPPEFVALAGKEVFGVYKKAYEYLNKRAITPEIIAKFNIGWCYAGEYEDRILIPSMNDEGNWNFFVTRAMDWRLKPKYKNCELDRQLIVFNEALINWDKTVFVVEGPFDHIVTPNSLPMLGKDLYPLMHSTIYDKAKSNVVVMTDPDAIDRGIEIYRQLDGGKLLGRVFINILPMKYDPAKYFEKFGWEAYKAQLRLSKRLID
jgi:DNA primase